MEERGVKGHAIYEVADGMGDRLVRIWKFLHKIATAQAPRNDRNEAFCRLESPCLLGSSYTRRGHVPALRVLRGGPGIATVRAPRNDMVGGDLYAIGCSCMRLPRRKRLAMTGMRLSVDWKVLAYWEVPTHGGDMSPPYYVVTSKTLLFKT